MSRLASADWAAVLGGDVYGREVLCRSGWGQ